MVKRTRRPCWQAQTAKAVASIAGPGLAGLILAVSGAGSVVAIDAASYGVSFFLPTIVKGFGASNFQTGVLAALPFVFGAIGMVTLSRNSDRTLKRREHVAFAMFLAAFGVAAAGLVSAPALVLGLLCLSQIGVSAMPPLFWPIPNTFLSGASAAASIAAINSIGNLSGFVGPYMMGLMKDATGTFTLGLVSLGVITALGGVAAMRLRVNSSSETVGSDVPASVAAYKA